MEIKTLVVGDLQTNCYLLIDPETKETAIVDPGGEADFISTTILENKLVPTAILLTHGHYDHCLGVLELKLNFNIPVYLHKADLFLYQKAHSTALHFSKTNIPTLPQIDHFLDDKETIIFGNSTIQTIHTPGHTPGSVSFIYKSSLNYLFSGDTLFSSSRIGATNHQYSSKSDLQKSIQKLKSILPKNSITHLYPGHENDEILN